MKEIIQVFNPTVIKQFLAIDNCYDNIAYDGSVPFSEFEPDVINKVWFILTQDGMTAGLILLEPLNSIMWVPHILVLEKYRGKCSEEWGNMAVKYMKTIYGAKKFLALTPYKAAKDYAKRMGFEYVAMLPNSIQKNGKLLDQYILELE